MELEPLPPPTRRKLEGYKYMAAQQAEKDYYMKQLARDYPNQSPWYHELVYDFCANTPQEELDRLMETGELDERESKYSTQNVEKLLKQYHNDTSN